MLDPTKLADVAKIVYPPEVLAKINALGDNDTYNESVEMEMADEMERESPAYEEALNQ